MSGQVTHLLYVRAKTMSKFQVILCWSRALPSATVALTCCLVVQVAASASATKSISQKVTKITLQELRALALARSSVDTALLLNTETQ